MIKRHTPLGASLQESNRIGNSMSWLRIIREPTRSESLLQSFLGRDGQKRLLVKINLQVASGFPTEPAIGLSLLHFWS